MRGLPTHLSYKRQLAKHARRLVKYAELYRTNLTNRQIARRLGVKPAMLSTYRRLLHLEPRIWLRPKPQPNKYAQRAIVTLKRHGFVEITGLYPRVMRITKYLQPPPRLVVLNFGTGLIAGTCKYSSTDLFGFHPIYSFYVYNDEAFERFKQEELSKRLETLFKKHNPKPSVGLRRAFTRLMHQYGIHWSNEWRGYVSESDKLIKSYL